MSENSTNVKIGHDFEPFIYNIWNTQKGNETEHFGSFPEIFMAIINIKVEVSQRRTIPLNRFQK